MPPRRLPIPLRFTRPRDLARREESRAWRALFWALGCVVGSATAMVGPWAGEGFFHAAGAGSSPKPCSVFFDHGEDVDDRSLTAELPPSPPAVPAMPAFEAEDVPDTPEPFVEPQELPELPNCNFHSPEPLLCADITVDTPDPFAPQPRAARRAAQPMRKPSPSMAAAPPSIRRASGSTRAQVVAEGDSIDEDRVRVSYLSAPKPPYPVSLRMSRSEGTVYVRIAVDAAGKPSQVEVVRSSGFYEMDGAARNWILAHWLFRPEKRGGRAVASVVSTSIHFEID